MERASWTFSSNEILIVRRQRMTISTRTVPRVDAHEHRLDGLAAIVDDMQRDLSA
jgi:hypothetical protein